MVPIHTLYRVYTTGSIVMITEMRCGIESNGIFVGNLPQLRSSRREYGVLLARRFIVGFGRSACLTCLRSSPLQVLLSLVRR